MEREHKIVVASEAGISIRSPRDIADALGACMGADGLILTEADLAPECFDLRTGLLGELFQKFTNYRIRLAIVLPSPAIYGPRIGELVYDHRSDNLIRFVGSEEEARAWLAAYR